MLWFGGTGYSNIRTIIEKIAVIPSKTLELLHFFLTLNYTRQKCKINNIWSNTLSIYHVKEWGEQAFLNVELNAGTPTAPLKNEIPSDFPVFQIDASLRCQAIPLRWNQKSVPTFLQHSRNQTTAHLQFREQNLAAVKTPEPCRELFMVSYRTSPKFRNARLG